MGMGIYNVHCTWIKLEAAFNIWINSKEKKFSYCFNCRVKLNQKSGWHILWIHWSPLCIQRQVTHSNGCLHPYLHNGNVQFLFRFNESKSQRAGLVFLLVSLHLKRRWWCMQIRNSFFRIFHFLSIVLNYWCTVIAQQQICHVRIANYFLNRNLYSKDGTPLLLLLLLTARWIKLTQERSKDYTE